MKRIVSPSMLSADFGFLERDTLMIEESAAEWIHIDVMDGVFVPNISFGFPVMKAIRKVARKPLDVHLMIVNPEKYVERFIEAGADWVTFHVEATDHPQEVIDLIHKAGAKAGISVKPATPIEKIVPYFSSLDLVLVMSVEPGFGGQKFIPDSRNKVRYLRQLIDAKGYRTLIEIDGGVGADNADEVWEAGADAIVAGSAVFKAADPAAEIKKIIDA